MITVEEALKKIYEVTESLGTEYISIEEANKRILAEDIKAKYDMPQFTQSAMDGYALCSEDILDASADKPIKVNIVGEVQANAYKNLKRLERGTSVRISTGAPLPVNANTVIMQEDAIVHNNTLIINKKLNPFDNVRKVGEEVKKGDVLVSSRTRLHSGILSVIASQGYSQINVFKKPRIAVITTGNEIVEVGKNLEFGQTYNTNYVFLSTFLKSYRFDITYSCAVGDNHQDLKQSIQSALKKADVIITTGGVSVGEKDLVKDISKECGFKEIFWKVLQKPGSPLYFAKQGQKYIFGLPGNPASAFICFCIYVMSFLDRIQNTSSDYCTKFIYGVLKKPVKPHNLKTLFIRCSIEYDKSGKIFLIPLHKQASHMITNLVQTQAIVKIESGKELLPEGSITQFFLLAF